MPALASAMVLPFRKKAVIVVPHISNAIFTDRQLTALRFLDCFGLVTHYDDGMAVASQCGILWHAGVLTQSPEMLITWDYRFVSRRNNENLASCGQAYRSFRTMMARDTTETEALPAGLESVTSDQAAPLIISSKWIDIAAIRKRLRNLQQLERAWYVPHYRSSKNDPALMEEANLWPAKPNLELSLP